MLIYTHTLTDTLELSWNVYRIFNFRIWKLVIKLFYFFQLNVSSRSVIVAEHCNVWWSLWFGREFTPGCKAMNAFRRKLAGMNFWMWCVPRDLNYFQCEWKLNDHYTYCYIGLLFNKHIAVYPKGQSIGAACWSAGSALSRKVIRRNQKKAITEIGTNRLGFSFGKCNLLHMGHNNVKYRYLMD